MKKKNQVTNSNTVEAPAPVETKTLTPIQEKREQLRKYSAAVKPLVTEGKFKTVNAAIIATIFRNELHQIFKSFDQWKIEGFKVKKGEKAFCVWGAPVAKNENEEESFFPFKFLFSNAQVEASKKEAQA